jgi:hypothetical protein
MQAEARDRYTRLDCYTVQPSCRVRLYSDQKARKQPNIIDVPGRCHPTLSEEVWGYKQVQVIYCFFIIFGCLLKVFFLSKIRFMGS